jgi:hypothetical protein
MESKLIDLHFTCLSPSDPDAALATIRLMDVRADFWPGSRRMITAWGTKAKLEAVSFEIAASAYDPNQQPYEDGGT